MNSWLPVANWKANQSAIVLDELEPRLNGNQPFESPGGRERMLHLSNMETAKMNTKKHHPVALVGISILLLAGVGVPIVSGQSGKVVSSYGPMNQDVTFDQIKAARMAVKAERAKEHMKLLNSRYDLSRRPAPRPSCQGKTHPRGADGQTSRD